MESWLIFQHYRVFSEWDNAVLKFERAMVCALIASRIALGKSGANISRGCLQMVARIGINSSGRSFPEKLSRAKETVTVP
jgi:hypothetical protein